MQKHFFPNQKAREIYEKHMTGSIIPYSVLKDTDSICIFFIFICKPSCNVPNEHFPNVLFEVILNNKILNRFDTSHKFLDQFNVRNKDLRKKLGYFAIENIDDLYFVTVAVNPKKYFEQFESDNVSKKHKGLRKGAAGMEFENYTRGINYVNENESFGPTINGKHSQFRFFVKKVLLEQIEKFKFAQVNDRRYYFSDGYVSLLFSDPFLHDINLFKKDKNQKIEAFLFEEKGKLKS